MAEKSPAAAPAGRFPHWPEAAIFAPSGLTGAEAAIVPEARSLAAVDGYPLALLSWPAATARPRARVVILHGVQSHAGWYHGLGRRLAAAGLDAHFPDRRGSGASRQGRGHAPSSSWLVEDVLRVLADVAGARGRPERPPIVLVGISWGGKLVVATAAAPGFKPLDGIALICPGLTPRVGVPLRQRLGVASALLSGRSESASFPIPLADPALFTANPDAQAFIAADPLSLRTGTAGLMGSSFFLDKAVKAAPAHVRQPALLMLAGHDRIVDNDKTRAYFDRLASSDKRLIEYPDAHHTLEFEPDAGLYVQDLIAWIERHVIQTPA